MTGQRSPGTRVLQRFELKNEQPDRGLGETWLAADHEDGGRDVLVKYPGAALTSPEAFYALVAKLKGASPTGVLPLVVGGVEGGAPFVVYEEARTRSLADWLDGYREAGTQPSLGMVQSIFGKVCSNLASAHQAGFVHRALSPRSVLVRRPKGGEASALIVDLELAPFFASEMLLATRPYRAPEQDERAAQSRRTESVAADVFALGVMLAEMLTLQSGPVAGRDLTWADFARRSADKVLATLVGLNRDVPEGVWAATAKALSRTIAERPGDAQKFRAQVRGALQAAGRLTDVSPTENDPPMPTRRAAASGAGRARVSSQPVIEGWQRAAVEAPPKVEVSAPVIVPVTAAPLAVPAAPLPQVAPWSSPEVRAAAAAQVVAAPSFAYADETAAEGDTDEPSSTWQDVAAPAHLTGGATVGADLFAEVDEPATNVMSAQVLSQTRQSRPGGETLALGDVGLDRVAPVASRPRPLMETVQMGDDLSPALARAARAGSDTLPIDGTMAAFGLSAGIARGSEESPDGTMMLDGPAPKVPMGRPIARPIVPMTPPAAIGRGFDAFAPAHSPSATLPVTDGPAPGAWMPHAVSQVPPGVSRPPAPRGSTPVARREGFPWAILAAVVMVGAALGVLVFTLTR